MAGGSYLKTNYRTFVNPSEHCLLSENNYTPTTEETQNSLEKRSQSPGSVLLEKYDGEGGGGVQKFKNIIFGSCVWLLNLCIFQGVELMSWQFQRQ